MLHADESTGKDNALRPGAQPIGEILDALRATWIASGFDYSLPMQTGDVWAVWHAHEQWIVIRDVLVDAIYSTPSTEAI
jgi:hypothetical protein